MASTALQYVVFLKTKLGILEAIHRNTAAQSDALEKKNYVLLGKLLGDRQECIERLGQIKCCFRDCSNAGENAETEKLEQSVRFLVQEVVNANSANVKKAEELKNDMAGAVRNLKLGRQAIRGGYYKKMPQRYGYFIDKKVGR